MMEQANADRECSPMGRFQQHQKRVAVVKQALVQATIQQITEYAAASAAAGGLDSADAHATRTALKLDRQGWERLSLLLRTVLEEITVLEEETRSREVAGETEELEDVGVVLMLFKAVPLGRLAEAQAAERSSDGHRTTPA